MKPLIAAAYFAALGWWLRASGMDEQIARYVRELYGELVDYTARRAAAARELPELDRERRKAVAS